MCSSCAIGLTIPIFPCWFSKYFHKCATGRDLELHNVNQSNVLANSPSSYPPTPEFQMNRRDFFYQGAWTAVLYGLRTGFDVIPFDVKSEWFHLRKSAECLLSSILAADWYWVILFFLWYETGFINFRVKFGADRVNLKIWDIDYWNDNVRRYQWRLIVYLTPSRQWYCFWRQIKLCAVHRV